MVPTVAGAPVPALLLPVNAPGEEAAIPALGSATVASPGGRPACHARGKAELGLVPHDSLGAGRSLLPIFFFSGGLNPGLCRLLEGRFPLAVSAFPPWLLAAHGGPISGVFQRSWKSSTLFFFGAGLPLSPVVLLICLFPCNAQAQLCAFLEVCLIYMNSSQSSAEKQLFFLGTARNR